MLMARAMFAGFLVWLDEPAESSLPHLVGAQFSWNGFSLTCACAAPAAKAEATAIAMTEAFIVHISFPWLFLDERVNPAAKRWEAVQQLRSAFWILALSELLPISMPVRDQRPVFKSGRGITLLRFFRRSSEWGKVRRSRYHGHCFTCPSRI